MDPKEKARLLASYEVGWWQAHGRRDTKKAMAFMTNEYVAQFGLTYETEKQQLV